MEQMYFAHLNERLNQTITQQLQYLEENQQEGWVFNPEVAQIEITTTFYASYENAYIPHSPEDYTLNPYQWYTAANNSQSSSQGQGEITYNVEPFKYRRERGHTYYELSNHLGNVLVTVTDMKIGIEGDNWTAEYYEATVVSVVDYYPFGSAMAGRKYNQGSYRYGFNGMEKDDEVKGEGNSYTTHYRLYDSRTGRWFSPDPVTISSLSPYVGIDDNPITKSDPNGDLACCNFAGAAANIMMEYGEQVIGNVIKDGLSTRAFIQDVDFADVLIEGADGLVNGAIPDVVKEVAKAGIDFKGGQLTLQPFDKALREGVISAGVNKGVEKSVGATKSAIKKHNQNLSKDLSKSQKKVQRLDNISGNGRPRQAQTNRAAEAKSNNIKIATAKGASDAVVELVDKVSSTPVLKSTAELGTAVAINETIKNPLQEATDVSKGKEIKLPSNVERDANGNIFINGERMYELPDNTRVDKEDLGGRLVNKDGYKKATGEYPQ